MTLRLLLLAGTQEAREIARGLADLEGVWSLASLAGATARPAPLAVPCRVGGFGGDAGFAAFLDTERIDAVVDATHPFAAVMAARAARIAQATGRAHLRVLRPAWEPGPGEAWTHLAREEEAAAHIPPGATVFLATGRQHLDRFANLAGRHVIARVIDPPAGPCPVPEARFVVARPPFTRAGETDLFRREGVDWLVAKNAGGAAGRAKLDAARDLGLAVAMIARPASPAAETVQSVNEALDWIRARR